MHTCWIRHPSERPSFPFLTNSLTDFYDSIDTKDNEANFYVTVSFPTRTPLSFIVTPRYFFSPTLKESCTPSRSYGIQPSIRQPPILPRPPSPSIRNPRLREPRILQPSSIPGPKALGVSWPKHSQTQRKVVWKKRKN